LVGNDEVTTLLHGTINYNLDVLQALQQANTLQKMQPIAGSWHDFN
jgi:hypothetical protein